MVNTQTSSYRPTSTVTTPTTTSRPSQGGQTTPTSTQLDLIVAVQNYLHRMVEQVEGMKILLLDEETTIFTSATLTQSHLLTKEVFLIDRLGREPTEAATAPSLTHLKAICFVRPHQPSYNLLKEELRRPRFGEYHLVFSNLVRKSALEALAEADESEVVKSVKEYYADFIAVNPDLFSLDMTVPKFHLFPPHSSPPLQWHRAALQRASEGLTAVLLALKKKPLIRYSQASSLTKELGEEVQRVMDNEHQLFQFPPSDSPPLLLILDRKSDPITPLLTPWTYQAMIHELLGIRNGRVDMSGCPDHVIDNNNSKEIVLNQDQDPFFRTNRDLNFGDLGANIKAYVDEYQGTSRSQAKVESIADMKRFVEAYPEFRRLAGNVTKHVALVGELSRLTDRDRLLEVSELEQSLACNDAHATDLKALQRIMMDDRVRPESKLRLALLYALRYEKSPNNATTSSIIPLLKTAQIPDHQIQLIKALLNYAGSDQRQNDLYGDSNLFARGRNVIRGLQGVENVYTQHQPLLARTLEDLVKGRLPTTDFPFLTQSSKLLPQEVILFMVGGCTYHEARAVTQFNRQHAPGLRIVLGGTTVHRSISYLEELADQFTLPS